MAAERPLARTGSVGFEVAGSVEDRLRLGAEAQDRCRRAGRAGLDVHAGKRAEQGSVHDIGEGGVDPFPACRAPGAAARRIDMRLKRADHAGVEQLDGRVEQPRGEVAGHEPGFEDAHRSLGDGGRSARQGQVGLGGGLERTDDRLVAGLDVGEARDARQQRGVAPRVGRDVLKGLEGRPHLGRRLRGEPAEQLVLARRVLVDRDPGAAGQLRDAVERRAVVAGLGERPEGGVEDALVGSEPPRADHRAVCERLPARRGPRLTSFAAGAGTR